MPRMMIRLSDEAAKALLARAKNERRDPRDQAAILVERELRRGDCGDPPRTEDRREVDP